jgi:hypothetical protein
MVGDFHTHTAEELAAGLSPDQWRRLPAGESSKSPRVYTGLGSVCCGCKRRPGSLAADPTIDRRSG